MNDILAPVFAVFLCEVFQMDIIQLENNSLEFASKIKDTDLQDVEADSYFVFSTLLERANWKFLKDFENIQALLSIFDEVIQFCHPKLWIFLKNNGIELIHFSFRWLFCLLLREFPLFLTVKIIDFYFVTTDNPQEMCLYFSMLLMFIFAPTIMKLDKDQALIFLQRLPTENWGYDDIDILFAEASSLKNVLRPIMMVDSQRYREYFS